MEIFDPKKLTKAVVVGYYDPSRPNYDGTFTIYTESNSILWHVRQSDIRPPEPTIEALKTENLSLRDHMSANEEKLRELELAFEILRKYL